MTRRHAFAVGLTILACSGAPADAQTPAPDQRGVRISVGDSTVLARQMLRAGQPELARDVANALVGANASDTSAWVILAQSHLQMGNIAAAKRAGRTAWRTSQTKREGFEAAFTMADIMAADEAYTRSQIWIRRAIQSAPGPQSEAIAIEAFRRVRQENPFAVELAFGLTPSSNVNSGNSNETTKFAFLEGTIFGFPLSEIEFRVPDDERPLSGIEVSAQTDLRYRIAQTQRSRTSLEFGLSGRTYIMSDSARASAPNVTGASLSYAQASVGVLHQWVPDGAQSPYSASLTYSHDWSGGHPARYEIVATAGTQFILDDQNAISVSGAIRYTDNFTSDTTAVTYSALSRWSHVFDNKHVFGLTGQIIHAASDTDDLTYEGALVGISYDFGDVVPGIDVSARYTAQIRDFANSAFDPAGRLDRITTAQIDVGLQDLQFYGFDPVVSIKGRRTESSADSLDTEGVQIGLNLRSSF